MIDVKYIASSGNEYDLKGTGIRMKTADFHSWKYKPELTQKKTGARVKYFTRDAQEFEITLQVSGTKTQRAAIVDAMHDDFEIDIRNNAPGVIVWGAWQIEGFVTESDTYPAKDTIHTINDITFYAPNPYWTKTESRTFYKAEPEPGSGLDYEHDYSHDYSDSRKISGGELWRRTFPLASDFKLQFFGPAGDPQVYINGHKIKVNDTIGEAETITIDSKKMTVTKTNDQGFTQNIFDARGKEESVFEQLPGGDLNVEWDLSFDMQIDIFEERSEPSWT